MTGGDNFCLRLNGFEKHVKTSWNKLQTKMDFCDVTLACANKQIQAHKVIISSCSPVLRNILKLNQNQNPIIYLRKVKYENLLNLLSFMYQGEVNVAQKDLASFLEVAADLNLRGLSDGMKESNYQNYVITATDFLEPFEEISDNDNHDYFMTAKNQNIKGAFENLTDKNNSNDCCLMESKNDKIKAEEKNDGENKNDQNLISTSTGNYFFCEKCRKHFSSRGGLFHHNKSSHEGVRYSCIKCEYKATQKASLKRHMEQTCKNRENKEMEESKIKGELENLIDKNISNDGYPMESKNADIKAEEENNGQNKNEKIITSTLAEKQFFCGKCQKQYSNRGNLWQHNKTSHEGVRYFCNNCDYKATQKSGLQRHMEQTCKSLVSSVKKEKNIENKEMEESNYHDSVSTVIDYVEPYHNSVSTSIEFMETFENSIDNCNDNHDYLMEAENEKIKGEVNGNIKGEVVENKVTQKSSPKKVKNSENKEMEVFSTVINLMETFENFIDDDNDNPDDLMEAENEKVKDESVESLIDTNNSNIGYLMEPENHKIKAEERNDGQNKNEQNIISTSSGNNFFCEKCQKHFSSRGGLFHHDKSSHEGVRYSCEKCEYKATQKASLKRHMEQTCKKRKNLEV